MFISKMISGQLGHMACERGNATFKKISRLKIGLN